MLLYSYIVILSIICLILDVVVLIVLPQQNCLLFGANIGNTCNQSRNAHCGLGQCYQTICHELSYCDKLTISDVKKISTEINFPFITAFIVTEMVLITFLIFLCIKETIYPSEEKVEKSKEHSDSEEYLVK
jgi:hypothetical protein